jgi:hypothetical protein
LTETTSPQPTVQPEVHDFKKMGILGLRFIQLIAISMFVVGFIWGGSDWINSLLPANSVITPLSVLLMLYGIIGSVVIEVAIRIVRRKK